MKKLFFYIPVFLFFYSCDNIIEENTPANVFEVFWRTLDLHYVYFEERNIDWDSIYLVYARQARNATEEDLIRIFQEIIEDFFGQRGERNVAIFSPEAWIMSWTPWSEVEGDTIVMISPNPWRVSEDFDENRIETNFFASQSKERRIVYFQPLRTFRWPDLELMEATVPNPIKFLADSLDFTNGLIIDISSNEHIAELILGFFSGEKTLYYLQDKTGRGHNDFGNRIPIRRRGMGYVPDDVPIVILTSAFTYNSGNIAVYMLSELRNNVTVIGTPTGGGGATLRTVFLPNGWRLRFPDRKFFSSTGRSMEFSFQPDIHIEVEDDREFWNTMFSAALEYLESLQR